MREVDSQWTSREMDTPQQKKTLQQEATTNLMQIW